MRKLLIGIPAVALLVMGCQKKIQDPGLSNDPVFRIEGLVNGGAYSYVAGLDGLYHFTDYHLDDYGAEVMTGRFAPASCLTENCAGSVQFIFKNGDSSGAIRASNFAYAFYNANQAKVYGLTVIPAGDTTNISTTILIGNDISSHNNLPLNANLYSEIPVTITVGAKDNLNGIKASSSMKYWPAIPDSCKQAVIQASIIDGSVRLQAITTQSQASFTWNNGDTTPVTTMDYNPDMVYGVTISAPDAGCSAVLSISQIPEITGRAFSTPEFKIVSRAPVSNEQQSGVEIQWIDGSGNIFSSANTPQDNASYFIINSINDYLENEHGIPTVQMQVTYRCMIGDSLHVSGLSPSMLLSGTGVIAVGQQ